MKVFNFLLFTVSCGKIIKMFCLNQPYSNPGQKLISHKTRYISQFIDSFFMWKLFSKLLSLVLYHLIY